MIELQLLLLIAALVGEAFHAGMETGIISIHRMRLEHSVRKGTKGADTLQAYLDDSDRLLGTTLVGTNVCLVVVSVVSASIAVRFLGQWGETVSSVVMSLVVLVACEYLPKAWFLARPLDRCSRFAGILRISEWILKPISKTTVWLTKGLVPGPSTSFSSPVPLVTKDDLIMLAKDGEDGGELSARERLMIHHVFELSHKRARDVMVPRARMVCVNGDVALAAFFDVARESGYTRYPVYDSASDECTGIINVFFVLSVPASDHGRPVSEFARPPLFIPEDMPVDDVLPKLRHFRQPLCMVQNKANQVTGLITIEDILQEIVGTL